MNSTRLTNSVAVIGLLVFTLSVGPLPSPAQERPADSKSDSARGAAVFKAPKGYMQAPLSDFRGTMFIHPKKPAGMFVTYPGDNETIESLRERARARVTKMFIHKDDASINWETKPLTPHPGDGQGTASASTAMQGEMEVQVVIYERTTGVRPFIYGYFAMRHKPGKGDDARFLDEQGKGVKEFDELWKSFPN